MHSISPQIDQRSLEAKLQRAQPPRTSTAPRIAPNPQAYASRTEGRSVAAKLGIPHKNPADAEVPAIKIKIFFIFYTPWVNLLIIL